MHQRALSALLALGAAAAVSCSPPDAGRPDLEGQAILQIVAAEDARPAGGAALETLIGATRHPRPSLRAAGVRGLGRLENPAMVGPVAALLDDGDPIVRMEAGNALAQAIHRGDGTAALSPLLRRLDHETDPGVRGVLARSVGRLSLDGTRSHEVTEALEAASHGLHGGFPEGVQLEGVALGMESYFRRLRGAPRPAAIQARLLEMAVYGRDGADDVELAERIRTVSVLAYAGAGLTPDEMALFLGDPAASVRRAAASRLAALPAGERMALVDRALADPSPQVRLEGARSLGVQSAGDDACPRLSITVERDADVGVRLMALDGLARPCVDGGTSLALLERTAAALPQGADAAWHAAAHALVSLALRNPARAAMVLPPFVGHANPFVRAYAARAAALTSQSQTLRTLSTDDDANVRAAAWEGLAATAGRGADPLLIAAAATDDAPQVLLAVAAALEGTELRAEALDAALVTVQRLGEARAETLRDPRVALLELAEAVGDANAAPRLEPFLRDFDAAVAERAARALQAWTGKRYLAAPRGAVPLPLPSLEDLHAMRSGTVVLHMARGGDIEIRLTPYEATTNAYRLFTLVRSGALDGLTFHRVVPNFVIQGGSPGANEYAGHGAFTRDEVGLDVQWRGTVGVSTRGRDTGDGQIYVNLVDDIRLDHDYTLLGVVVSGMDVVDGILEGNVIRSAEFAPGR